MKSSKILKLWQIRKSWRITNMKFITRNLKKAGVPTYQMTPNPTTTVRLRGRVKRTLKKKSSDFILRSKKSKIVRIPHWKSYIQNGSYTKEITLL